jgi:hypothetical protein
LLQQRPGPRQQRLAGGGGGDRAAVAVEEAYARVSFQGLDLLGERLAGDAQPVRGPVTQPPAVPADDIGPTDAVLLSRDQHGDSLDHSGRDLLTRVPLLLTTAAAGQAAQLLGARTVISAHV